MTSEIILNIKNVTVRYGSTVALEDVSAAIPCNSLTALAGPNGAGKSTLLRAILGWLPLTRGEIRIGDSHAHHALPRLAYLPQRPEIDWDFPITVESVVRQGRFPARGLWRSYRRDDDEMIESALNEMGLTAVRKRQIRCLSGGQQQKMFLARALAQGADIFLLDEPFAGLDARATDDLVSRLSTWREQGRTVLAVVHDLDLAREAFPHAVLLNTRVIEVGRSIDVLRSSNISAAYQLARV